MSDVIAEEVRAAAIAKGVERVEHHACSGCGYMTAYIMTPDGRLYFDAGCYCSRRPVLAEERSWQDVANWINMQSSPMWREKLRDAFGLPKEEPPHA